MNCERPIRYAYAALRVAMALTWDFESWVIPRDSASFSSLRLLTPSR